MGDEVWLEVKEQEDGWNWDEPVVSRSESLRPSNALNEDQYDFAIVLKNNLDDRTATAVREKRRLWKLNQKKDETSTAQPDTEPSDEDSDDHNGDEDEEGSDAAKNLGGAAISTFPLALLFFILPAYDANAASPAGFA